MTQDYTGVRGSPLQFCHLHVLYHLCRRGWSQDHSVHLTPWQVGIHLKQIHAVSTYRWSFLIYSSNIQWRWDKDNGSRFWWNWALLVQTFMLAADVWWLPFWDSWLLRNPVLHYRIGWENHWLCKKKKRRLEFGFMTIMKNSHFSSMLNGKPIYSLNKIQHPMWRKSAFKSSNGNVKLKSEIYRW